MSFGELSVEEMSVRGIVRSGNCPSGNCPSVKCLRWNVCQSGNCPRTIKSRTLNFQVNHEKRNNEILKSLKSTGSLSDKQYKKIKAVGSTPDVLYGLCKVHKTIVDVCPHLRLILSAIGPTTYKIAKFLYLYWLTWQLNNSLLSALFRFQ